MTRARFAAAALLAALAQAGVAQTDRNGRIQSLNMDGEAIAITYAKRELKRRG